MSGNIPRKWRDPAEPCVQYIGDCSKDDAERALADCVREECARVRILFFKFKLKCWDINVCPPEQAAALSSFEMFEDIDGQLDNSIYTAQPPMVCLHHPC